MAIFLSEDHYFNTFPLKYQKSCVYLQQDLKINKEYMPEICRFYGLVIYLYWMGHNPPHRQVVYGDYECSISIMERIVDGKIPANVVSKVNQWMDIHQDEIMKLWEKASKGEKIEKIEPLK